MPKHTEKFDPNEVEGLLNQARAGSIEARNELLYRFQRLIATLIHCIITGRPNYWSSYQKTFLRMFGSKSTPLQNIASMLKKELSNYEKDELFSMGQLAVMLAIEKCETNLASTIVICFKDLIHNVIKDPDKLTAELDQFATYDISADDALALEIFAGNLNAEEWAAYDAIIHGEATVVPSGLKIKFGNYLSN